MLLMARPLRDELAADAFKQSTQTNQTSLNDAVGEETRWLVVFPKLSLAGSQILRNCFAGVASLPHEGQAWLEGSWRTASSARLRRGSAPSRRS